MPNHIVTRRLLLVQLGVEEAVALVDGRGGSDRPWAPGYPDDGALVAAGFVMTAAFEWRRAAECFAWDTDSADRCWQNWERLMHLPRALAHAIGASEALSDFPEHQEFFTTRLAA